MARFAQSQQPTPTNIHSNLLCVILAACTKHDWSVSLSSSWVYVSSPAFSKRLCFSASCVFRAPARCARAPSRNMAKAPWRSASTPRNSLTHWFSCSLATALFVWTQRYRELTGQKMGIAKLDCTFPYILLFYILEETSHCGFLNAIDILII